MNAESDRAVAALRAELAGFFRRRVADEHAAEDLLQETFVRMERSIGELRDEERLGPWVYRIARNVLADHRRAAFASAPLGDHDPTIRDEFEENRNEVIERWLHGMLNDLPEEYREAVRLADVEGLPQQVVAERLGISLSGAKSRVQRGRQRLRGLLQSCCRLEFDRRGNVLDYERHGSCETCDGD